MQKEANKSKAVKTALIIVLLLVVLAGAVGVTTALSKRAVGKGNANANGSSGVSSIQSTVILDGIIFSHNSDEARESDNLGHLFIREQNREKIEAIIAKQGYFDLTLEIKDCPIDVPLIWEVAYEDSEDYYECSSLVTISFDESNTRKAVLRFFSLEPEDGKEVTILVYDDNVNNQYMIKVELHGINGMYVV